MKDSLLKILAVDDDKLILWALEKACKGRELDVKTATSVELALEEIGKQHFDLFLIDFNLRDKGHLELLEAIDSCCPYVPIIIMTTTDAESCELNDLIRSTRKMGAWHVLEKPFSLDKMISFIEVIFQDQGNVKVCLNSLTHNYDQEKRQKLRRPYVQVVNFSFKTIVDGVSRRVVSKGILTDISGAVGEDIDCLFVTGGLAAAETKTREQPDPAALEAFVAGAMMSPTYALGFLR